MIVVPWFGWLTFILLIALACAAGLSVSKLLPWSEQAMRSGLDYAWGFALAAFLPGFGTVIALGFLPGDSHIFHLISVMTSLVFVIVACMLLRSLNGISSQTENSKFSNFSAVEKVLAVATVFVVLLLFLISVLVPLTQNDALEYIQAARVLFHSRDLSSYPVVDAQSNSFGFYGPWTHPPLYVAWLYLADIIQNQADAPGVTRLISPLFTLAGAGIVFALGSTINRLTGFASVLLFLTTPIFFLGSGSALIDSLPVLGLAMMMASVSGISARSVPRGIIIGVVIAMALWTHSQAILILPITFVAIISFIGLRNWKYAAIEIMAIIAMVLLIGSWPYINNVIIFGSPISDNPEVFKLPSLHWKDYFSVGRGLETFAARIQYGLFKGWFAVEAYGFIYWIAIIGVLFAFQDVRSFIRRWLFKNDARTPVNSYDIKLLSSVILGTYLLGIIASLLLSIDLMIKNERYGLLIIPAVAILAGYGIIQFSSRVEKLMIFQRFNTILPGLIVTIFATAVVFQSTVLAYYAFRSKNIDIANLGADLSQKLAKTAQVNAVLQANNLPGKNNLVLSLKPADMYFSNFKQISYLDPRLLKFYKHRKLGSAKNALDRLNVNYVHVPDYTLPPYFNSQLQNILSNPELSQLVIDEKGTQIYKLEDSKLRRGLIQDLSPGKKSWNIRQYLVLGGRKVFGFIPTSSPEAILPASFPNSQRKKPDLKIFHRNIVQVLQMGEGSKLPTEKELFKVKPGKQYIVTIEVSGRGGVRLLVNNYGIKNKNPSINNKILAGTFELSIDQPDQVFIRRIKVGPNIQFLGLVIESNGYSQINLKSVTITPLI